MFKTLKDFDFKEKKVLVRCDFNVPIDNQGNILDDFRLRASLPTIQYLIEKKAKIILMSHLGEPEGRVAAILRLDKVKEKLSEILQKPVLKTDDCIGQKAKEQTQGLKEGEVLLLENLRFCREETENDPGFAKQLSELADVYINDAFSVCHRGHASIARVPEYLPAFVGLLLEKEISSLDKVLKNPVRPMTAVIGGKKVETKTKFIDKISETADLVIISGLIKKEIEDKKIVFKNQDKIIGPLNNLSGLDIGPDSIKVFTEKILEAKTIIWNGPFGKTEEPEFTKGTLAIARAIIESKAYSVVGGGETVEFIQRQGLIPEFSHVSTGGGAMLAYLSGEELPGLKALEVRPL